MQHFQTNMSNYINVQGFYEKSDNTKIAYIHTNPLFDGYVCLPVQCQLLNEPNSIERPLEKNNAGNCIIAMFKNLFNSLAR